MINNKKALILAGGLPQIKLIQELELRGYQTILADYNDNPVARSYADYFYKESTLDVSKIREIAQKEGVELIITACTDQALATVSLLAEELDLPCYTSADLGNCVTNKCKMKSVFVSNDIPTAEYVTVSSFDECESYSYPVVVKPADCNSSKGVVKVYQHSNLKTAVETAIAYSRTSTAIIEEFIEGLEISVDLFVQNGIAKVLCISQSDKLVDDKRFVIFRGYYPATISSRVRNKIEEIAQKIVDSFGLIDCPMLMQVLVKEDEVYVLEFSARTGGCIKYHLIELASGIDVIKATVDLFEGKKPFIFPKPSDKIIVDEFIYCYNGVFDHILGFNECIKLGLLEGVFLLKSPGTHIEKVESSGDRIAAITYVADSYYDYIKKHNEVISRIKVISNEGKDIMRHDLLPKL